MAGVLLDTHALYWLVSGERELTPDALLAIGEAQSSGRLFVSPISAWELALARRKSNNVPQMGDTAVASWYRAAVREISAKVLPINLAIATEAADVVARTCHKDPGDCYLIATARRRKIGLVSRDAAIARLAASGYLDMVAC